MLGPVMFAWSTARHHDHGRDRRPAPSDARARRDIVGLTVERCSQILTEIAGFEMPIPAGSEGDA